MQNKTSRCRALLGTYVEVHIRDAGRVAAGSIEGCIDQAFAAIARCGQLMSFHDPASDLSRINQLAHKQTVTVDAWTWQVLQQAKNFFDSSDGLFDCGVGAQLMDWKILPVHAWRVPSQDAQSSSIADLVLLPDHAVCLKRPTCLDLGGIAKGFAVDRAIDMLREAGVASALVNAGGDLRVLGELEESLYLRHPVNPSQLVLMGAIRDGAVATSAPYFSRQALDAAPVSELVHAVSRQPLLQQRSYSVIAPDCCTADALTKVLAAGMAPDSDCFLRHGAQTFVM